MAVLVTPFAVARAASTLECPTPGGKITCEGDQFARCESSGGRIFASCKSLRKSFTSDDDRVKVIGGALLNRDISDAELPQIRLMLERGTLDTPSGQVRFEVPDYAKSFQQTIDLHPIELDHSITPRRLYRATTCIDLGQLGGVRCQSVDGLDGNKAKVDALKALCGSSQGCLENPEIRTTIDQMPSP